MPDTRKRRRKKEKLFRRQGGLCCYCKIEMLLSFDRPRRGVTVPLNLATFEHLDDRFCDERGTRGGEIRIVLACGKCNNEIGKKRQAEQPLDELQRRSKRHTVPMGRTVEYVEMILQTFQG